MNILHTLAQSFQYDTYGNDAYYYTNSGSVDAATAAAAFAGLMVFTLILAAISYVVYALLLSFIFKKAGVAQWIAWVPFYNTWKVFELGGQHGALSLMLYLPIVQIVGIVFLFIAMYNIGLKLGKSGAFVLLAIFLPIVWLVWLAFDKSTWDKKAGAPSITPAA